MEMTMEEASILLAFLAREGVLPNLQSRLVGAGVRASPDRAPERADEESESGEEQVEWGERSHGGGVVLPEEPGSPIDPDDSIPF